MQEINKQLYKIASLIECNSDIPSVSLANKIRMKIRNNPTSSYKSLQEMIPPYSDLILAHTITTDHIMEILGLESQYKSAIDALFNRSDVFYEILEKMLSLL